MKYIGLDVGSKTIGIASGHGVISFGRDTIRFKEYNFNEAIKLLTKVITQEKPDVIVVGHPLSMDGNKSTTTMMIEDFVAKLSQIISIKIILWDERLTTKTVETLLVSADVSRTKRKIHKDKLAAQIILQNYFDYLHHQVTTK